MSQFNSKSFFDIAGTIMVNFLRHSLLSSLKILILADFEEILLKKRIFKQF